MSGKRKLRIELLVLLLIVIAVGIGAPAMKFAILQYDAWRLARFAHRISAADRVVGTVLRSSVQVTLTGDSAQEIIRAVTSARSARPPLGKAYACAFMTKATFFKGENVLGDVEICGALFLIHESEPPFRNDSRLLSDAIERPLQEKLLMTR